MINETTLSFFFLNFPFLDTDVHRSTSYGVYVSQLVRFARVSSHVGDFDTRNKVLTATLLNQGYQNNKFIFYWRHFDLLSKYNVEMKTLLLLGLSEPDINGDLMYRLRILMNDNGFPYHFKKVNC